MKDDSISIKIKESRINSMYTSSESDKKELDNKNRLMQAFGSLYQNANLASCKIDPRVHDQLKKWCESGNNFVVNVGRSGSGKTYFCASIYYWILNKHQDIIHTNIRQYLESLQRSIANEVNVEIPMKKYKEVRYLSIDDLGCTSCTDWQKDVILSLLDYRYEHQKPTLITSNLRYEEMEKKLDDRVASRIYDKRNIIIEDWQTNYRKNTNIRC